MPTCDIVIINRLGLHARAAAKFIQTAGAYACDVTVQKAGKQVNGKSIMGLMMLAASMGSEIKITTSGADEDEAMAALVSLINGRFGETE